MKDPIEALYTDHDHLVERLNALEDLCRAALGGATPSELAAELNAIARVLNEEVDVHSRKEETGLFPALRRHPTPPGLLATMVTEHEAVRTAVRAFTAGSAAWLGGHGGQCRMPRVEPAREARGKLSLHMQKENLILFPLARRVLGPEELAEVAAAFDRVTSS